MELNILHLYPDSMNLYGEYANLSVLRRLLASMGVTACVKSCTCEDTPDFTDVDLIYMGAGTERSQKAVLTALVHHADRLKAAAEEGAVVLFTGSAMPTLGASITDSRGKVWPALGLADFTTVETDRRSGVDVIAETSLLDTPVVGFMNKCSTTRGITAPLFSKLSLGFGNDGEHSGEGYVSGNILATHITGPVLVKNPHLLALLVRRLFARRSWPLPESIPALPHQQDAYAVTLRELQARVK